MSNNDFKHFFDLSQHGQNCWKISTVFPEIPEAEEEKSHAASRDRMVGIDNIQRSPDLD